MEIFEIRWNNYKRDKEYLIGTLIHDDQYFFRYNKDEIWEAINNGFRPFPEFKDVGAVYTSENLFATFATRIGDKKDFDNNDLVEKARLATDRVFVKRKTKEVKDNAS